MNSKYVDGLIVSIGQWKVVPSEERRDGSAECGGPPHVPKGVGILLYLAPERPDIMYVLKKLSTKLAAPVEADMELLRYVGKYLKGNTGFGIVSQEKLSG